jgi:hypothetical protein
MVGIKYDSLNDLNGQALAWSNKANAKIHAAANEIPFERVRKECLSPITREYTIDKLNIRKVGKGCLIPFGGSQYSVPSEYVGRDVSVVALDSMLTCYFGRKQIALHRISREKHDMVINSHHYRKLTIKQSFDAENALFDGDKIIDFPVRPHDFARYDEVLE